MTTNICLCLGIRNVCGFPENIEYAFIRLAAEVINEDVCTQHN